MGKHAQCPNCCSVDSGRAVYQCKNGHVFCETCRSSKGLVNTYCPKQECGEVASRIGEIK